MLPARPAVLQRRPERVAVLLSSYTSRFGLRSRAGDEPDVWLSEAGSPLHLRVGRRKVRVYEERRGVGAFPRPSA